LLTHSDYSLSIKRVMIIIAKLVKQTLLANARYYCIPISFSI